MFTEVFHNIRSPPNLFVAQRQGVGPLQQEHFQRTQWQCNNLFKVVKFTVNVQKKWDTRLGVQNATDCISLGKKHCINLKTWPVCENVYRKKLNLKPPTHCSHVHRLHRLQTQHQGSASSLCCTCCTKATCGWWPSGTIFGKTVL